MMRVTIYSIFAFLLVSSQLAIAWAEKTDSRSLIAALSYNFAKYASWPEHVVTSETVEICYFSTRLKKSFDALQEKPIYDKPVSVRQLSRIEQSDACHLVFVDNSERDMIQRLFVHLADRPVLTVSDIAGFIDEGGMIEIVKFNNKFRFKVNMKQLEKARLKMSSQVLKLAVDVK